MSRARPPGDGYKRTPPHRGEPEQTMTPKSGCLLYKVLPETGQGLHEALAHFWSHSGEDVVEMAASTETQAKITVN